MISLWVLINRLIDAILGPMEGLPPLVPLTVGAAVMGVAAMIIYKYTSNQDGIKDAKEKIKGHFLEVWLFIDDAAVIARAQVLIMSNALRYLGYAMPPLVIMIVLFFPLFANFETRYASRPVKPGENALIKVRLAQHFPDWEKISLELPEGLELVGHPVRFTRRVMESETSLKEKRLEYEADFKVRALNAGAFDLKFTVNGQTFTVPFAAGAAYGTRVPFYAGADLGRALLYPPLVTVPAASNVGWVEIKYPEASFPCFGWNAWWVWPFLIVSMIAAYAVKGVFNVEI